MYVLCGRQSYSGLAFSPVSTETANIGSYTLRKCSGFTLDATIASISSSIGQMSFSVTAWPSASIPSTSFSMSKRIVPAIAYATTSGGDARNACFAYGWMRPSKLRLPDSTAVAYRSRSMISFWMHRIQRTGHAVAGRAGEGDDAEAEFSSSDSSPALTRRARYATRRSPVAPARQHRLSRYNVTAFEPGASEVFTHGLRVSPRGFALRAANPRRSRCADCWCSCSS